MIPVAGGGGGGDLRITAVKIFCLYIYKGEFSCYLDSYEPGFYYNMFSLF